MTYAETDLIESIQGLAGQDVASLTQAQLDGIDQFHSGGAEAVTRLVAGLQLQSDMTVLDVGSGFGGPARQVARTSGAKVVGVDTTRSYVEAARALTITPVRVEFICADVSAIERSDFDAAYTMHVQMNVADKLAFFRAISDRLKSGARLAVFEVCRLGKAEPSWPVPWSIDGSDSHLAFPGELKSTIQASGFELIEWADETEWITDWFSDAGTRMVNAQTEATLPALLDDGVARMINFVGAVADGTLGIYRGLFRKAG